jgi:hypothetical protein
VVRQTSKINLVSLVHTCFDFFIVLAQVRSCLEFDLTLGVIPSEYVASCCSLNFYMLYSTLLASRKLIRSYIYRLDSRSTFSYREILFCRTYPP